MSDPRSFEVCEAERKMVGLGRWFSSSMSGLIIVLLVIGIAAGLAAGIPLGLLWGK